MKYIRYTSKGNTVGLEEDIISFWEIASDGYIKRNIEILSDGNRLKYSEHHAADTMGQLPEGIVTEENLQDRSYGESLEIDSNLFEAEWTKEAINFN